MIYSKEIHASGKHSNKYVLSQDFKKTTLPCSYTTRHEDVSERNDSAVSFLTLAQVSSCLISHFIMEKNIHHLCKCASADWDLIILSTGIRRLVRH
jgi:hypothetical protein